MDEEIRFWEKGYEEKFSSLKDVLTTLTILVTPD